MTQRRRLWLLIALGAIGAGVTGAVVWQQQNALPRRLGVVAEGRLYRSGELTPEQLERVAREHGVRRVVSLLNPDVPESVAERAAAERLGIAWENVPLTGDGASAPADRERLRALLLDPNAPPTLVHCAAGANRTGLACGIYRLHHDGWTLQQVMDEMRKYGFKDKAHHENLRQALAAEAELAKHLTETPPGEHPPDGK